MSSLMLDSIGPFLGVLKHAYIHTVSYSVPFIRPDIQDLMAESILVA